MDLLVVMDSDEPIAQRIRRVTEVAKVRFLPMDIIVRTPAELAERLAMGDFFLQVRRAAALGPEGHLHAAPELLAYPADRSLPVRAARPASRSDPVSYGYPHLFTPARVRVSGRNVVLRQCRSITPRYYSRF